MVNAGRTLKVCPGRKSPTDWKSVCFERSVVPLFQSKAGKPSDIGFGESGVLVEQTQGFAAAVIVDETIEGASVLGMEESDNERAVKRQDSLHVIEAEIGVDVGFVVLHPLLQFLAARLNLFFRKTRIKTAVGEAGSIMSGILYRKGCPRVTVAKDMGGTVNKQEEHHPLLGERAHGVVGQADIDVGSGKKEEDGEITNEPGDIDAVHGGEIVLTP